MARGRRQKPHHPSWGGDPIVGLYKCPDGRWRINATGQKFTEPDERRAIQRFQDWTLKNRPAPTIELVADVQGDLPPIQAATTIDGQRVPHESARFVADVVEAALNDPAINFTPAAKVEASYGIPEKLFWPWLRDLLIDKPEYVAKMTGLPEVAALRHLPLPKPSFKLRELLAVYKSHADVKEDTKRESAKTFEDFLGLTEAKTLEDLTTDRLAKYRDAIRGRVNSPGTIAAYFGRVKWIIAFAKTEGWAADQIDAALSRMSVLKAPKDRRTHQPTPITPDDFHKLYTTAEKHYPDWKPRLLLMLNLCLHFDECLDLEWSDFQIDNGTFCTKRNKRGRVIRAATLWPETVATLQAIKRTGRDHVLISRHGSRFNAKGQWKTWNKLRIAAGCPDAQMDDIRDGSYTAACNAPGVDEKFARLMAGHRSHGMQDNYVARNPAIVAPACDAVYACYGPLPAVEKPPTMMLVA